MRSFLPSYELRRATTMDAAVSALGEAPGVWRPFAGGTDLMVQLAAGALPHRKFISIWGIEELRRIRVDDDALVLGAMTTFTDIQRHALVREEFPLLCRAAAETGGIANQNRGTIGGNIANASPAADTPPALLVYDAQIELVSIRGRRTVPYETFHRGYKQMDLAPDELIAAIRLPRTTGWIQHYRKVGARRAQAISKICFAARARADASRVHDLRLAFGSVAPTVIRAKHAEAVLRGSELDAQSLGSADAALSQDIAPIDDVRSTAVYRRTVAGRLLGEFLRMLSVS